ncbi:Initiator Replication protein [Roseomonas rosea]|uniref:Initiator Replication protein n=1 Tax=Muricoccus roseus TaxID=198092 RepID=A0A1M6RG68_9PROT|nr:replication initiation protein [Roseomonas rosea]SHK31471.1 Initiator Replication protein [Roseomonas rosea]
MSEAPILTLALTPRGQEAVKPAELIQVTGHHELTLNARRAITVLWHHAHMQGVAEGKRYTVEIDELKPAGHKGYEMVEEAIEALMRTLLVVKLPNGKTRRVQFLGGNDLDSPDRPAGVLTYSFDAMLIEILQKSTIWGKIALPIIMSFSSKYSVSLYENVAQVANLSFKTQIEYSLDDFRAMLGVPPGKYKTFGELNMHVLKPAVAEVNALAPFGLAVLPVKQGKKVVKVNVGWWRKSDEELQSAYREGQASKVGRKARISGKAEHVLSPMPSQERLRRRSPKTSLLPAK